MNRTHAVAVVVLFAASASLAVASPAVGALLTIPAVFLLTWAIPLLAVRLLTGSLGAGNCVPHASGDRFTTSRDGSCPTC